MMSPIVLVLEITLIGMGLVFLAIMLLWGLMALLVRLAQDRELPSAARKEALMIAKEKAAVAAVALALVYEHSHLPKEFPLPPTALVSAWQAVTRSRIFSKRGQVR